MKESIETLMGARDDINRAINLYLGAKSGALASKKTRNIVLNDMIGYLRRAQQQLNIATEALSEERWK